MFVIFGAVLVDAAERRREGVLNPLQNPALVGRQARFAAPDVHLRRRAAEGRRRRVLGGRELQMQGNLAADPIRSENRIKATNDCNGRRSPRGQLCGCGNCSLEPP